MIAAKISTGIREKMIEWIMSQYVRRKSSTVRVLHVRNHEKAALKLYLAHNMGWYHRAAKDMVDICIAIGKCFEINVKMKLFERGIAFFAYVVSIPWLKIPLVLFK